MANAATSELNIIFGDFYEILRLKLQGGSRLRVDNNGWVRNETELLLYGDFDAAIEVVENKDIEQEQKKHSHTASSLS